MSVLMCVDASVCLSHLPPVSFVLFLALLQCSVVVYYSVGGFIILRSCWDSFMKRVSLLFGRIFRTRLSWDRISNIDSDGIGVFSNVRHLMI